MFNILLRLSSAKTESFSFAVCDISDDLVLNVDLLFSQWMCRKSNLIFFRSPVQISTAESTRHPQQRGGSSHGAPAPAGPERNQPGDGRCGQHPAADHRGQLPETMI